MKEKINFYYAWSALMFLAINTLLVISGVFDYRFNLLVSILIAFAFYALVWTDFFVNKRIRSTGYILMFITVNCYYVSFMFKSYYIFCNYSVSLKLPIIILITLALLINGIAFFFIGRVKEKSTYKLLAISYFVLIMVDFYRYVWLNLLL